MTEERAHLIGGDARGPTGASKEAATAKSTKATGTYDHPLIALAANA
jgi:hypothetical protein